MDWNAFLAELVGDFVANIPAIFALITTVSINMYQVKKQTGTFPNIAELTRTTLGTAFKTSEDGIKLSLADSQKAIETMLENSKIAIRREITDLSELLSKNITGVLSNMKSELARFNAELVSNRDQTNLMVIENKMYIDVIASLISRDPDKIRDGIATIISTRLNMTKEELEQYPRNLITNAPAFEQAIREALILVGQVKFDEILRNAGYERKV